MTRRRSSAPVVLATRRLLFLLLLVPAVVLAACGSGVSSPDVGATGRPSELPPATEPGASPTLPPEPTVEPEPTEAVEPDPTAEPAPEPTDEPTPEPEPTDTPDLGAAADCTGTDENRDFFAAVAAAVDWPVYCPVLPRGWFVESGQYRLAAGGRMEITYRGPDGAGLRLQQGVFCEGAACTPSGSEVGPTAFGDLDGTLYQLDGGWAIAVPGDGATAWILTVMGVGQERARTFSQSLIRLD